MLSEEYFVELFMHTALQVKDLQILCQLIEWRFANAEPTVEVYQQVLRISFWKDKLLDGKWSNTEAEFFDGLKLLELITRWQASESIETKTRVTAEKWLGRVKPVDEG